MEILKKVFPLSFREKKTTGALILNILIYVLCNAVVGVIIALLPILEILGGILSLYFTAGIVLSILDYLKVIK